MACGSGISQAPPWPGCHRRSQPRTPSWWPWGIRPPGSPQGTKWLGWRTSDLYTPRFLIDWFWALGDPHRRPGGRNDTNLLVVSACPTRTASFCEWLTTWGKCFSGSSFQVFFSRQKVQTVLFFWQVGGIYNIFFKKMRKLLLMIVQDLWSCPFTSASCRLPQH